MLFNSWSYAIFLPIVFILYWSFPHKYRWAVLFVFSYYFYMSWNVKYVTLIFLTTLISYVAALIVDSTDNQVTRKLCVSFTFVVSIGILFVFKYFNFALESITALMNALSLKMHSVTLELLLPVGISFYTFQTLSYVVDVYRGDVKAEQHFGKYATFISFFPQLVAGPIERTNNLLPQIKNEKFFDYDQATYGLKLMAWGFFKKVVVADRFAQYVDIVYGNVEGYSGFALVLASFLFSFQIYCDFSGYSDIAVGSAKLLGIDLMQNFSAPYFATSIKEFWSRWHISLSTWFRDYLYIPLGGNRCSRSRQRLNLLVTFSVSGLWHGANWTYFWWGFLHGVGQVLENWLCGDKRRKNKLLTSSNLSGWVFAAFVFCFTTLTWVFFRAEKLTDAFYIFMHAFDGIMNFPQYIKNGLMIVLVEKEVMVDVVIMLFVLLSYDYFSLKCDVIKKISSMKLIPRWSIYILIVLLILALLPIESGGEFIYFQF